MYLSYFGSCYYILYAELWFYSFVTFLSLSFEILLSVTESVQHFLKSWNVEWSLFTLVHFSWFSVSNKKSFRPLRNVFFFQFWLSNLWSHSIQGWLGGERWVIVSAMLHNCKCLFIFEITFFYCLQYVEFFYGKYRDIGLHVMSNIQVSLLIYKQWLWTFLTSYAE